MGNIWHLFKFFVSISCVLLISKKLWKIILSMFKDSIKYEKWRFVILINVFLQKRVTTVIFEFLEVFWENLL